jgi:glucose-6-phosphate 1-dehydrogenase
MDNSNPNSTLLIVIGISGDLSKRYLLPALSEVAKANQLPENFKLLGISRRNISIGDIFNTPSLEQLVEKVQATMYTINLEDSAEYATLAENIRLYNAEQIIFYFAVPPESVQPIVTNLGAAGLNQPNIKLLLEKPFGVDLDSAKKAIEAVDQYYKADQVYRIDHYLAKEMAQNISVFLGGNSLFRNAWSNKFVESIEVVVAEEIGIEGRVKFYEQTGALRDVVQSHALQLVALTIMEPCDDVFEFEGLPGRRLEALGSLSIKDNNPQLAIRAQYQGYREEVNNPESNTETFVYIELESNLDKWRGVPIRIIAGKNLAAKATEIRVNFNKTHESQANRLVLRIQPHERVELDVWIKEPGYERKLKKMKIAFDYGQHFDGLPDAYEQVLVEAIRSKQHLFASSSEVITAWQILQPIIDQWHAAGSNGLKIYAPGSDSKDVIAP